MVKVITLFLVFIAILALLGRLRMPGFRLPRRKSAKRCERCGRPLIGRAACECGGKA